MPDVKNTIALHDDRPFFEKSLRFGLEHGLLSRESLSKIEADAPKGIVQIADHFGTAYLRTDLESATQRLLNLISLYLEDFTNGDLRSAALSLRDNTLLSHSRGGSEMLKRLHAMPGETGLYARKTDPLAQKAFVNERSFAFPLSVSNYRAQIEACQANQLRIDFACWLARQMDAKPEDYEDFSAEELIRSAMLVLYVSAKKLEMPTKSQFVHYLEILRKKSFKHKPVTLESFLHNAPEAFAELSRQARQDFIDHTLPRLKSAEKSPDEILHGEAQGAFFIREVPAEDVVAYDKLVAKAWVRMTKGNADDPAVLATLFLNVATDQPAKASALMKEAKAIIAAFRNQGFNSNAVLAFIEEHAPFEQREDLKSMWLEDLRPDAEVHLADTDPQMPDTHMDRALKYFKQNCAASWKSSSR
jgi:hypothetical protein